jgi:hypothetical protein
VAFQRRQGLKTKWGSNEVTVGPLEEGRRRCRYCDKPAKYRFIITFVETGNRWPSISVCSKKCKTLYLFKIGIL